MKRSLGYSIGLWSIFLLLCCGIARAVPWLPFGPDGGDARSLAPDPHDPKHLYLGAANGWMYESHDGGKDWRRLARVGKRDDLVLDSIVVDASDARHLVVGAWVLGHPDGGLYVSHDAGATWTSNPQMAGQSIRALTASVSDPRVMVAGTLQGVFRSLDGGVRWDQISEKGSKELHEVESVAIDPVDPKIIYAGTWHLPWKTEDGGQHWNNIKEGVIEDSDVFSIIVDPKSPNVVYASACSGIYKSENGGRRFAKVQGIPSTARRTRILMQDPNRLATVYAGTTEGLFRSDDSGVTWVRTTGPELIVNDVYVDPADSTHVVLATDRAGVLTSHDRGNSFEDSNAGFSARQITSYVADALRPANVYVGVINDKEWGGVYASETGGLSWVQESAGLGGRDVFSLAQASDGSILAGTSHGIFRLNGAMWSRAGETAAIAPHISVRGPRGRQALRSPAAAAPVTAFDGSVYAMARNGDTLYAATSEGLLSSGTAGERWSPIPALKNQELLYLSVVRNMIVTGDLRSAMLSTDSGRSWTELRLPPSLSQLAAVALDGSGTVWVGGREGLFASANHGMTWDTLKTVYIRDVNSLFYDAPTDRLLVTAGGVNTMAFAVHLPDRTVKSWDTGWNLRFARAVGDHMVGATLFDGIVVQPQMVDSAEVARH